MRLFNLLTLYLISIMLITGCIGGGSGTVPQDHFYRLPQNKPVDALTAAPLISGSLAIGKFSANGLYRGRALLFIDTHKPLEVQRYYYHHWTESPPQLIQENLLHYMRSKRVATEVIRFRPGIPANAYIIGRINEFERIMQDNGIAVKVNLELELQSADQSPVFRRAYSATVKVADGKLHTTVRRYGEALQQIYEEFVSDIMGNRNSLP